MSDGRSVPVGEGAPADRRIHSRRRRRCPRRSASRSTGGRRTGRAVQLDRSGGADLPAGGGQVRCKLNSNYLVLPPFTGKEEGSYYVMASTGEI